MLARRHFGWPEPRLSARRTAPAAHGCTSRSTSHRGTAIILRVDPPPAEPEIDVRTIADLPFHVLGRFQKPLAMGRMRGGEVEGVSSKELFEQVRDLSLGLSALGHGDRAIAWRSSPRAGPNGS